MNETEKNYRQQERLEYWKDIVMHDATVWDKDKDRRRWREELYAGTKRMKPICERQEEEWEDAEKECFHVKNIIAENIETCVESAIPPPKVVACKKEDEELARKAENLLRHICNRLALQGVNDMAERTQTIQGGCFILTEWDNDAMTHTDVGDIKVSFLHPDVVIPQDGVYTDVDDMDHIALRLPRTKDYIRRRYGISVQSASETAMDVKGDNKGTSRNMVEQYILYYRNDRGGIGKLSWVDDIVLEDFEDYQARRLLRCKQCGALAINDEAVERQDETEEAELEVSGKKEDTVQRCRFCECTEFEETESEFEEIMTPKRVTTANGTKLDFPGADFSTQPYTVPASSKVPYYSPHSFPVKLMKNISKWGQLMGESDVDKLEDAQNALKQVDYNIFSQMEQNRPITVLPPDTHIETSVEEGKVIRPSNEGMKWVDRIKTITFTGDLSAQLNMRAQAYEDGRQASGITDSLQGRKDWTATSAKAKEISASKAEGRLQSRREMKRKAWGAVYREIFRLYLAYADEPRKIRVERAAGEVEFETFDRWDFLKRDSTGSYYWEDDFIFTTDSSSGLANDREKMWQEATACFQAGTLGDPTDPRTRVLYWGLLEAYHHPMAGLMKKKLEEQLQQEQEAQAMQAAMQQGAQQMPEREAPDEIGRAAAMGGMPQERMTPEQIGQLAAMNGGVL